MKVVLATHNAHKVEELRRILGPRLDGIELIAYDGPEPVEDGDSFTANALIKARAAAQHAGLPAIADDSGICVDALGGAPGIRSARWAGTRIDADNRDRLLGDLADVTSRTAHFECAAAFVIPPASGQADAGEREDHAIGFEHVELGVWPGTISHEATGSGGFGYDPIFTPDGYTVSSAELRPDEKNAISHRALAFERLIGVVREQLAV